MWKCLPPSDWSHPRLNDSVGQAGGNVWSVCNEGAPECMKDLVMRKITISLLAEDRTSVPAIIL